jgi:hypothetical protein
MLVVELMLSPEVNLFFLMFMDDKLLHSIILFLDYNFCGVRTSCIYFCYSSIIIRTIIRMTRRVIRLEHVYVDRREMDGCSIIIPCYYTTTILTY